MLGVIAFLSTTVFLSPAGMVLLLPFAVVRFLDAGHRERFARLISAQPTGVFLLVYSSILCIPVFFLGSPLVSNFEASILGPFPYIILVVLAVFVGWTFHRRDLTMVVLLTCVEVLVGIIEYAMGVHSIVGATFVGETSLDATELLYFRRVYGLSLNSSGYAFKVLVAFTIAMVLRSEWPKKLWIVVMGILGIGFITSFGRSALIAAVAGWIVYYGSRNKKVVVLTLATAAIIAVVFSNTLVENITLGKAGTDVAGERTTVFSGFAQILMDRPLIGNAARKVWLDAGGKLYHAHNSYLELLASNGLIVAIPFLWGYYLSVVHRRVQFALPILIYSFMQYGIFWGLSFHDVVFSGLMAYVLTRDRLGSAEQVRVGQMHISNEVLSEQKKNAAGELASTSLG